MALSALLFGPPGAGKTTSLGFSFPKAHFIGRAMTPGQYPEGLQSIVSTCGYSDFTFHHAEDLEAARKIVKSLPKGSIVVFDDYSDLARMTVRKSKKKFKNGYDVWDNVIDTALDLFVDLGPHSIAVFNCWLKRANADKGTPRGPKLVGQLIEEVPAKCQMVLEATYQPMRKPWPWAYSVSPSPLDITKDRLNLVYPISPAPMNLAEIFRARGVALPYKYDWQEKLTGQVFDLLAASPNPETERAGLKKAMEAQGLDTFQQAWVLRDAYDRLTIQVSLAKAASGQSNNLF
jgi:hypothetical protein